MGNRAARSLAQVKRPDSEARSAVVEIEEVRLLAPFSSRFVGSVDEPRPGARVYEETLELTGWLLGLEDAPVLALELSVDGRTYRVPLAGLRPDVGRAYSHRLRAEESGYFLAARLPQQSEFEIELQAVLGGEEGLPFALIRGRRRQRDLAALGWPLVSVVIPCYNQARFLGAAIESVLAQSYRNFELIAVDDGSSDETEAVAESYGVRCLRQPNQGMSAARNTGLAACQGEHVVFLDADDVLFPHALEENLDCITAHPDCGFVAGSFDFIDERGMRVPRRIHRGAPPESDHYECALRGNFIAGPPASVMYRRSALEAVGGFDTDFLSYADYRSYFDIARRYPVHLHNAVVAGYRMHGSNTSGNNARMLRYALRGLRIEKRRAGRDARLRRAYRAGVAAWKYWYAEPVAGEMADHFRAGRWRAGIRSLSVLVRLSPTTLVRAAACGCPARDQRASGSSDVG